MKQLTAIIVGSGAGGGIPQWNCNCSICSMAWANKPNIKARTQSSLAVSCDHQNWLLINASPDLRQQIIANPQLQPLASLRGSPIKCVLPTNADVDHIAGLLTMREQQSFTLYATEATHTVLAQNSIFNVLAPGIVKRERIVLDEKFDPLPGLTVKPFAVPGKVALYLEDDNPAIGDASETTIGLEIAALGKRIMYIPGCAAVDARVKAYASGADLLLYDGTTFTDDELPRLHLLSKSAHRMGHTAIMGEGGSLHAFDNLGIKQKCYTHINNSNPILIENGPERRLVEDAGWRVAEDTMVLTP